MSTVIKRAVATVAMLLVAGLVQAEENAIDLDLGAILEKACKKESFDTRFKSGEYFLPKDGDGGPFHDKFMPMVAPGTCNQAILYYKAVSESIGLPLIVGSAESTVTQIVEFLGFKGMTANDLEVQTPEHLMPATEDDFTALKNDAEFPANFKARQLADFQNDKVVAVRFFAPKVANYDHAPGLSALPGWRKLVRLQALEGSPAEDAGIKAAWILFNTVVLPKAGTGTVDIFPTKNHQDEYVNAAAIQIILERKAEAFQGTEPGKSGPSLYFLAYFGRFDRDDKTSVPYGLSLSLKAKFDVSDAYKGAAKDIYYVPSACAQCHGLPFTGEKLEKLDHALDGQRATRLSLNYLDTDQWFDARNSKDFVSLEDHDIPLLIDADQKKDPVGYDVVFDRFRILNTLIAEQNLAAFPNSLPLRAATAWLDNHKGKVDHIDKWSRALPPTTSNGLVWDRSNANDFELLPQLNRLCARCHMTMFFGIFDKYSVAIRACEAIKRIKHDDPKVELYQRMPQGRQLASSDKAALMLYLENLYREKFPQTAGGPLQCP